MLVTQLVAVAKQCCTEAIPASQWGLLGAQGAGGRQNQDSWLKTAKGRLHSVWHQVEGEFWGARAHLAFFHSLGAISWWVATACASLVHVYIVTTAMLFSSLYLSNQLYLNPWTLWLFSPLREEGSEQTAMCCLATRRVKAQHHAQGALTACLKWPRW